MNPFIATAKFAAATYSKSTTQLTFRPSDAKAFINAANDIPDKDLYTGDDPEKYGRETEPHITVLYGLDEHNPAAVSDLAAHRRPIRVRLGKISRFESEKFDVLKVEVKSGPLHNLHNTLRENLPNDYRFPEYNPHVTLAYVKKGAAEEFDGDDRFDGWEFTFDRLTLNSNLGNRAYVPFTGLRSVPLDRFRKAASKVIVDTHGKFVFDNPQMKNRFRKLANPFLKEALTPEESLSRLNSQIAEEMKRKREAEANSFGNRVTQSIAEGTESIAQGVEGAKNRAGELALGATSAVGDVGQKVTDIGRNIADAHDQNTTQIANVISGGIDSITPDPEPPSPFNMERAMGARERLLRQIAGREAATDRIHTTLGRSFSPTSGQNRETFNTATTDILGPARQELGRRATLLDQSISGLQDQYANAGDELAALQNNFFTNKYGITSQQTPVNEAGVQIARNAVGDVIAPSVQGTEQALAEAGRALDTNLQNINAPWYNKMPWGTIGAGGLAGGGLGGLIGGRKGAIAGALLGALGGYGLNQYSQAQA